jgi:hypothetical protein
MLDPGRAFPTAHRDRVEAVRFVILAVGGDPTVGRPLDRASLSRDDGLIGVSEAVARSRLHLDERDDPAATRDEVDLTAFSTVVPLEDRPAAILEEAGGEPLRPRPALTSASCLQSPRSMAPAGRRGAARGRPIAAAIIRS